MNQGEDKPVVEFVTRLKQKAQQCNFFGVDHDIKDQIVFICHSVSREKL